MNFVEHLSQQDYRDVLEALPTGVYLVDRERRILLWSSGAEELTGYLRQEVLGRSCRDDLLMHCDEENTVLCGTACPLQQTMHDGHARTAKMFLLHKDGHRVPVSVRAAPLRNEHGSIIGAVECFEKRLVFPTLDLVLRRISQIATEDETTGLPDRRATETRMHLYLQAYEASPVPFGVLSLEVDDLAEIRRSAGGNAADAVLRVTANTLAANLGPNDFLGSWSPEHLVAVVTACTSPTLSRVAAGFKRLVRMEGIPWWGDRLRVTLSVGAAVVHSGDTVHALVGRAERSLEGNKQERGDQVAVDE